MLASISYSRYSGQWNSMRGFGEPLDPLANLR